MVFLFLAASLGAVADEPSLRTVLARLERYVVSYEQGLSSMVAIERYVQTQSGSAGVDQTRTLVSDFLFLRLPGEDGPWLGLREVLEVDGQPIGNHAERLREIVAASPQDARVRAMAMARENARYNIGPVVRTVNVPVGVIAWMHPRLRNRFTFEQQADEIVEGVRAWRIAFAERGGPTIVRTPAGRNVRSSGRIWVDPTDGRVLRTELTNTLGGLRVTITVAFTMNREFGVLVPSRMTERYEDGAVQLMTGAEYSNFRRFGVTTTIRNP